MRTYAIAISFAVLLGTVTGIAARVGLSSGTERDVNAIAVNVPPANGGGASSAVPTDGTPTLEQTDANPGMELILGRGTVKGGLTLGAWWVEPGAVLKLMPLGDVTLDGIVNLLDLISVARSRDDVPVDTAWLDLNKDGVMNVLDVIIAGKNFGANVES